MCETKNLCLWLVQLVYILGLLGFCLWLAVHPRSPDYTIIKFSVPLTNHNNGSSHGRIEYELDIKNPNRDSCILYDDTFLTFYYGEDKVGNKTIPCFYQGKNREKSEIHRLSDQMDVETRLWTDLRKAIMNASAELRVDLSTKIVYYTWGIKSKQHGINREGKIRIGKDGMLLNNKEVKLRHASKKLKL
ncbi:hypothetical protein ES319_D10G017000v1 [Gossypium barbadense]|uniref:Late embryogenesis abundant protein LEA-2 subgroup domain-containing protein n=1 Tax=Gossypium barbadense TaxID=3634 RepID=A0A5J5PLE8_GOSBA|nr:hypothetical protein ES319_D10G017000v1 [Gossypium barbadense]